MAVKDVEMFVLEKRKNEALRKEWDKATKTEVKLKEDNKEEFFNKKLYPIIKKYGFDFSFSDFCEYKKHSFKPQSSDGELSDDELFVVAGDNNKLQIELTSEEKERYYYLKNKNRTSKEQNEFADFNIKLLHVCGMYNVSCYSPKPST